MTQALEQLPHKTCLKFVLLLGTYNFSKHSVEVSKRGHVKAKREEANRVGQTYATTYCIRLATRLRYVATSWMMLDQI